jgi:E3 UFM1-protein ligase 1
MEEILRLQKQLAEVQMQDAAHRISERNAVEIILKLIEQKKIELIFTTSGKEYLTHKQLRNEIKDAITVHEGRVSTMDMAADIGVDHKHIENALGDVLRADPSLTFVAGQVLDSHYLDLICEEINESLAEAGTLTVTSQASRYGLPTDMLTSVLEGRIAAGVISGRIRAGELYTEAFVTRHNARVRGAFTAVTKPTPFATNTQKYQLLESLARSMCARSAPPLVPPSAASRVY